MPSYKHIATTLHCIWQLECIQGKMEVYALVHYTEYAKLVSSRTFKKYSRRLCTWDKRGFTSLHGVVAVILIVSGQVLDYITLSKTITKCKSGRNKLEQLTMQLGHQHMNVLPISTGHLKP